jgi:hypothetical protein
VQEFFQHGRFKFTVRVVSSMFTEKGVSYMFIVRVVSYMLLFTVRMYSFMSCVSFLLLVSINKLVFSFSDAEDQRYEDVEPFARTGELRPFSSGVVDVKKTAFQTCVFCIYRGPVYVMFTIMFCP